MLGQTVKVQAVVVGDFQDGGLGSNGDLNGFFLQEETTDEDGNPLTSEGIFVFDGFSPAVDVALFSLVEVVGEVSEFNGNTQISATSVTVVDAGDYFGQISVPDVILPLDTLEPFENMLVKFPESLFITEAFNFDRFGEVRLSQGSRLFQYTQTHPPDTAGFQAYLEEIAGRTITLDDGSTAQNPNPLTFLGEPFNNMNAFRMGDTVTNLEGVVQYSFGTYRVHPVGDATTLQKENPRPTQPPAVGGSLKLASLNVLNFFTTIDESGNPGSGPNNLDPRGADNIEEFNRQTQKLLTTLLEMNADILGLVELENEFIADQNGDRLFSIGFLVTELNSVFGGSRVYTAVDPGRSFVDTGDAISVGFIYDTLTVGHNTDETSILDDSVLSSLGLSGQIFDGVSTNRASLAATFEDLSSGGCITIANNHFKSKGSVFPDGNNADAGDGQGNNNAIRLQASIAVKTWLDTYPTSNTCENIAIIGDLNSYAMEDPIAYLEEEMYTNLEVAFADPSAEIYSFVFDGQFGTLDYILANEPLLSQVTGAAVWHVNSDEADALDYNLDFGRDPSLFDGSDPFRNSDHDPILVGLSLSARPCSACSIGCGTTTVTSGVCFIEIKLDCDDAWDGEICFDCLSPTSFVLTETKPLATTSGTCLMPPGPIDLAELKLDCKDTDGNEAKLEIVNTFLDAGNGRDKGMESDSSGKGKGRSTRGRRETRHLLQSRRALRLTGEAESGGSKGKGKGNREPETCMIA